MIFFDLKFKNTLVETCIFEIYVLISENIEDIIDSNEILVIHIC